MGSLGGISRGRAGFGVSLEAGGAARHLLGSGGRGRTRPNGYLGQSDTERECWCDRLGGFLTKADNVETGVGRSLAEES